MCGSWPLGFVGDAGSTDPHVGAAPLLRMTRPLNTPYRFKETIKAHGLLSFQRNDKSPWAFRHTLDSCIIAPFPPKRKYYSSNFVIVDKSIPLLLPDMCKKGTYPAHSLRKPHYVAYLEALRLRKYRKRRYPFGYLLLCWRYLSFRAVSSQVLWAEASLTSVFGMGTGGPSP